MHIRVVIPEYGNRHLTERCIKSIPQPSAYADTFGCIPDIEIYIGDDGFYNMKESSTMFLPYGPHVKVINWSNNVGFARNVNRTVSEACKNISLDEIGDTVLFILNSDIYFPNSSDFKLLNTRANDYYEICGPSILVPPNFVHAMGWGPHPQHFSPERYKEEYNAPLPFAAYKNRQMTMLSGCCLCMPAMFWFTLGGFDCKSFVAYYEDDDFGIRANLAGYLVRVAFEANIIHKCAQSMDQELTVHKECREKSERNFKIKWPEITWNSTGNYEIADTISPLDARIVYSGDGRSEFKC